jgi:hypothetical protein
LRRRLQRRPRRRARRHGVCHATPGCNPAHWFGHVEHTSTKSRARWQGYGASPFDINRTHVRNVMIVRRPRYVAALGADA